MKTNETNKSSWKIELLGVRGSMAVTPKQYQEFGCDTLCVRLETEDKVLFLDAGSGLMYGQAGKETHVLIGHPHLDHLLGFSKWMQLADPSKHIRIYMADHEGKSCSEILHTLYGPPFWPIHLENISEGLEYVSIRGDFKIGNLTIKTLEGNHPGGVTHFRIEDGQRSLVYAVDCELTEEAANNLAEFAKDCDLLICDGQLWDEDVVSKRGWGHSSITEAAQLGKRCGAKQTVLVHFDPASTDEELRKHEQALRNKYPDCVFGRQGETRIL
ncbi:MAG: hypothetical protein J5546_07290 [Lachnospiraceae bacterium]|nr:hypothetical protein [Lachnospiraceae bacterium]